MIFQAKSYPNVPEDTPLHHPPGQDHDQGHGQGVPKVPELGELFWMDGDAVHRLWLLHAGPGDAGREPDVIIPEPGGEGDQYGGHVQARGVIASSNSVWSVLMMTLLLVL